MRRTNAKIVGGVLVLAIILVGIAYAAITNTELKISGTGKAEGSQSNFVVEFIGTPTTSGDGTTVATIDEKVKTKGTITVTKLTTRGETATAKYTVKNKSAELSADLKAEATCSNDDYFEVICSLDKTTLKAQEETILTVSVKMLRTPVDEAKEDVTADIMAKITAEPKQPGEEKNGGSDTVTSQKTNPYLPKGFRQVSSATATRGLTIQDSQGNQYVWVEVPKTAEVYPTAGLTITEFTNDEYTAIETDLHTYTADYRKDESGTETKFTDTYYSDGATGLTSEQYTELKQKMLKSVYQNGGFYIGKYETGIEDTARTSETEPTETPVIKSNAYPYNYITCSQAQTLANNMEHGDRTTSLLFGVQWDLVMKYLEKKGTSKADLKTNSTSWGNCSNNAWNITNENFKYAESENGYLQPWTTATEKSKTARECILLSTGASESFSKMGIYDLAGNVWEWTLEYTSNTDDPCADRGGGHKNSGSWYTASYRHAITTTLADYDFGFRCVLY